ncbi:MAG: DOMON-like domain-containing protein [Synechococcaceae cyanobacterium ELA263]
MDTDHHFALQPFESLPQLAELAITGEISRRGQRLKIRYVLQGPLETVLIPPPAEPPSRLDELWQTTCFELFLACCGCEPYWEFNLSPAGHWNIYRLQGYRRGLAAEPAYQQLALQVTSDPQELRLALELDLPPGLEADQPLEAAITAVIQQRSGLVSYWALAHGGLEPDFHRRDGFRLSL